MGNFFMLCGAGISVTAVVFAIVLRTSVVAGIFGNGGPLVRMAGPKFSGAGVAGNARIVSVQPTGSSVQQGGMPPEYRCHISLHVQPSDGEPYDATVTQLVDSIALPNIGPGSTVAVQVDSANRQNVMIDFSQPIRRAAA